MTLAFSDDKSKTLVGMYNNTCIYNIAYQVILVTVGTSMQTPFTYIAMKGKTTVI